MSSVTTAIPIDKIVALDNPREVFDEAGILGLAASIEEVGLLEPIVLREHPDEDGQYVLIAGERRVRALRKLRDQGKLDKGYEVPAEVRAIDGDHFVRSVAENVARMDMTIMEEARACQRLLDEGRDISQVARALGKVSKGGRPNTQWVQWRLDLLDLIPEAQDLADKGKLKAKLAWYTARLDPDQQAYILRKMPQFKSETEAVNFAMGIHDANQQAALLADGQNEEQREKQRDLRSKAERALSRIDSLSRTLRDLASTSPAELSIALEGRSALILEAMDRLVGLATDARNVVGKANGIEQAVAESSREKSVEAA